MDLNTVSTPGMLASVFIGVRRSRMPPLTEGQALPLGHTGKHDLRACVAACTWPRTVSAVQKPPASSSLLGYRTAQAMRAPPSCAESGAYVAPARVRPPPLACCEHAEICCDAGCAACRKLSVHHGTATSNCCHILRAVHDRAVSTE